MKGTEKQITWAQDILANAIRNCESVIRKDEENGIFAQRAPLYKIMKKAIEKIAATTDDASKVISNRHLFDGDTIERNVMRAETLIRRGTLTVEQFAQQNGVDYSEITETETTEATETETEATETTGSDVRAKAINLAASYYANWQYSRVSLNYDAERDYRNKYDGALCMARLLGIEAAEIERTAWRRYGEEIGKAHKANNATW